MAKKKKPAARARAKAAVATQPGVSLDTMAVEVGSTLAAALYALDARLTAVERRLPTTDRRDRARRW